MKPFHRAAHATLVATAIVALSGCTSGKTCGEGQTLCATSCVNTATDNANCGACGKSCAGGEACSGGACALSCQTGLVDCDGTCIDPSTSNAHCGASGSCRDAGAGATCPPGNVCSAGACGLTCQAGLVDCGGTCIDPLTNNAHCGASGGCTDAGAGVQCAMGSVCSGGTCALSCQGTLVDCGGTCIDPQTSNAHCGASGDCSGADAGVICLAGNVCSGGVCGLSCQSGLIDCGGTCVDPQTSNAHCGASAGCTGATSGVACPSGEVCMSGACALSCQAGQLDCAGSCIDPQTSNAHCGASGDCTGTDAGVACDAGYLCSGGACGLSCQQYLVDCDGVCTDPMSSNQHCGASGTCTGMTAGNFCGPGTSCGMGFCYSTCGAGLLLCSGACTRTSIDPNNCGGCGLACVNPVNASGVCVNSTCKYVCTPGYLDCDTIETNGCEVNTQTDGNNCGRCGNRCGLTADCTMGTCVPRKRVFTSSALYNGNLGGLTGADAKCQALANAIMLGGTWMAWLSDSTGSPSTRFTHAAVPYGLVNGTKIANNWSGLISGTLLAPINATETGGATPVGTTTCNGGSYQTVWSNTNSNGSLVNTTYSCTNWTSTSGSASWGWATQTAATWSTWCTGGACSATSPLYCFEQ